MPASLQMCSPTSRLPVNVILRTRRSCTRRSPSSPPGPVSVLMPSGGSPACSRTSVSLSADSGVSVAGLTITALPPAMAGPTLWQTRFSGKLNGVMATTIPHGTRSVTPNFPLPDGTASSGTVSPCSRRAASADSFSVSTAREASSLPSARILPSSSEIVRPNSSTRAAMRSAALRRMAARSCAVSLAIARAPRSAACNARSTSPRSARGTVSITELS